MRIRKSIQCLGLVPPIGPGENRVLGEVGVWHFKVGVGPDLVAELVARRHITFFVQPREVQGYFAVRVDRDE